MGNRDEDIRNQQREQWTAASEGWINKREEVSSPTRPITEHIVKLSRVRPGAQVLDLACGVGDPAFTIADIVGLDGSVLGLDIAEAMVKGALSWAKEHDVSNANFRTIKNELELGVSNECFDLITCRHGLMFMPNPQLALQAMASATKKEGRITISSWGLPQNSPAFTLPGQVIGKYVNLPTPDPKAPGLFALSTSEIHKKLFKGIGFQDIEVHKFDCPVMIAESPEEMWEIITTVGGPMVKIIKDLQSNISELIRKDFLETLFNMFQSRRVILTAEAIVTTGTKPLVV